MSQPDRKTFRRLRLTGVVAAVVAVVIVVYGIATRASENSRLHDWTEAQALPTVAIISPSAGANSNGLELPGRFEAYTRAPIYARTSGYLKSWKYDIGAHVKAGDLLGEIETPDLDQQLQQARADLATAQANERLSALTAQRWQKILAMNAVARQDVDEKLGDYEAKKAATASAKANVDRYVATKGFTRLVAPFDGIVTARNTDVGALISVGGTVGQELFVVSDTHRLRVYVNVPQSNVPGIAPGTKATIIAPEHPDKTYMATVEAVVAVGQRRVRHEPDAARRRQPVGRAVARWLRDRAPRSRRPSRRRDGAGERTDLQREGPVGRDGRHGQPRRDQAGRDRARSRQGHRAQRRHRRKRSRDREPARRHRQRRRGAHRWRRAEGHVRKEGLIARHRCTRSGRSSQRADATAIHPLRV